MSTNQTNEKETAAARTLYNRFSNHRYLSPTPGRLPLIFYRPEKDSDILDDATCASLKQRGFNCVITKGTAITLPKSMASASKHGLSPIVTHSCLDPSLADQTADEVETPEELVKILKMTGLPTKGFFSRCLPSFDHIEQLQENFGLLEDALKSGKGTINSECLSVFALPHQQHPPLLAKPGNQYTAAGFLPKVQTCLGPGVWLTATPAMPVDVVTKPNSGIKGFFNNMEIMGLMSNYTARPAWICINEKADTKVLCTALNALAYGVQGLVFTNIPESDSGSLSDKAPKALERIRELEGVFLGARQIDTRHALYPGTDSDSTLLNGCFFPELRDTFGPLLKISPATTGDTLKATVSHLSLMPMQSKIKPMEGSDETLDFLVIVNQDMTASKKVKLEFNAFYNLYEVKSARIQSTTDLNQNPLVETKVSLPSSTIERTLAPGDALVFRWE